MENSMTDRTWMNQLPTFELETPRLQVRLAEERDVPAILDFYRSNRERLRPFDPERPDYFYTESFWQRQVGQNLEDFASGRALRLFLFHRDSPRATIGNIGFSNFVRGIGQYCTVGYSIDGAHEGRGLMSEALRSAIEFVFHSLNLHRVEANYMPHNRRSGELLRRLGFAVEGYSRDYLRINGRWEDHVRAALINPDWIAPLPE
jgi:[ribosomal protein S5]-alanine N-acetyltransferase